MNKPTIIDRAAWLPLRLELLEREKAFSKAKDELAAARRELPWVRVEEPYAFDTSRGRATLAELFRGHSQLLVYHFMFAPSAAAGCPHCSFWADQFNGSVSHLPARDVSLVAVSRAPLAKLAAFKRRLGWSFDWVSSGPSEFNFDFGVSFRAEDRAAGKAMYNYASLPSGMPSELPGFSVFAKDEDGAVFHTYSTFGRGIELANATYQLLDLLPKGRDEGAGPLAWVRYNDDYPRSA